MNNPLLQAYFEQTEENINNQWKASESCEQREELFRCQQALQGMKNYLESFLRGK